MEALRAEEARLKEEEEDATARALGAFFAFDTFFTHPVVSTFDRVPFRLTDRPALFFLAERPAVRGGAVGGGAEREARAAAERARDGDARGAEREAREHRGERASGGEIDTKSCSHLMRVISSVS